ncbi:RNA-directed DNA polymerase, partial [mine drainage metagenome]
YGWIRKRHAGLNQGNLVRRHLPNWEMRHGSIEMFRPQKVAITRYRFRGARIPTPWSNETTGSPAPAA